MFRSVLRTLGALALAWLALPAASRAESLSLDSCITLALARHPGLHAATLDVATADARVRQAGALEPPVAGVSAGKLGSSLGNAERDVSFRVSQDVPLFGQRGRAIGVAATERMLAASERDGFALRLRGEVIRAYRRLQADSMALATVHELGATARDLEQMVGIRLRTGGARYLDVLRARAERARIENDAADAERALGEDRRALNVLMARPPDAPLAVADTLAFATLDPPLDSLLARAMRTRPGLAAARAEIARADARLALARSEALPRASVSAGLDRVPGANGPGFGGEVALTLPFAPWSGAGARRDEALLARDAAAARLEAAERSVDAAVRTAHANARAAGERAERFERLLLADAHDAIRAAIQNYQAGQIEGLELLETLRTLRTIQLEHVRALLDYALALTDLEVAE